MLSGLSSYPSALFIIAINTYLFILVVCDDPALQEWVHSLRLTIADKEVLRNGKWLTANHIQAANKLLRKAFPNQNGLCDTHHLSQKEFWSSKPEDFVQVIFVKYGHWACLSNKFSNESIELFDSLHTIPTEVEEGSICRQASCILKSSLPELVIDIVGVQKQIGEDDCGLFAISMAFDLCCGIDPFTQMVNQAEMRQHLMLCFEMEALSPFPKLPRKKTTKMKRVIKSVSFKIYCICRGPEYGLMVQCDQCQEWFHAVCTNIPNNVLLNINLPWLCSSCKFSCTNNTCMMCLPNTCKCMHNYVHR